MSNSNLGMTSTTPIATQVPGGAPPTLEQLATQIAALQTALSAVQTQVGIMEREVSGFAGMSQSVGSLQTAFTGHTHNLNPNIQVGSVPQGESTFGTTQTLDIFWEGSVLNTPVLNTTGPVEPPPPKSF